MATSYLLVCRQVCSETGRTLPSWLWYGKRTVKVRVGSRGACWPHAVPVDHISRAKTRH
jgi:hypothetical protein